MMAISSAASAHMEIPVGTCIICSPSHLLFFRLSVRSRIRKAAALVYREFGQLFMKEEILGSQEMTPCEHPSAMAEDRAPPVT